MTPAGSIAWSTQPAAAAAPDATDAALRSRREALVERFALGQADLGGLYYEMAVRDRVRDDVLAGAVAELNRVESELAQLDRVLRGEGGAYAGDCSVCGSPAGVADAFCSRCGHPLHEPAGDSG
jgi:hypothetical protein